MQENRWDGEIADVIESCSNKTDQVEERISDLDDKTSEITPSDKK